MIIPSSKYPSQTAVDLVHYPQGKARNVTASGDGTGTPLEKDWINDLWGWMQSLVADAGITPSGVPDQVGASDLLTAVKTIAVRRPIAVCTVTPSVTVSLGNPYTINQQFGATGFSVAGNLVTVPSIGWYRISLVGTLQSSLTTNPLLLSIGLSTTSLVGTARARRYSATAAEDVSFSITVLVNITSPSTQKISVTSTDAAVSVGTQTTTLLVEQVG